MWVCACGHVAWQVTVCGRGAGGIVTQYKEPKQMSHRSMDACMADPGDFLLSDFSKIERPQLLHIAFQVCPRHARNVLKYVLLLCHSMACALVI